MTYSDETVDKYTLDSEFKNSFRLIILGNV
jgi:hypothetical protein